MIRAVIGALHRHTGYLEWTDVDDIAWATSTVYSRTTALRTLQPRAVQD